MKPVLREPVCPPGAGPARGRRRLWPWLLAIGLLPFLLLAGVAVSYLTLDREAALLRREVMRATGTEWRTRLQVSVGGATLAALRAGLTMVRTPALDQIRPAFKALERASVGVYWRDDDGEPPGGDAEWREVDRALEAQGWSRLAGVWNRSERVLAYGRPEAEGRESFPICVAVVKGRDLVVVSARLEAGALGDLLAQHLPRERWDVLARR